jgi:4,5-dihydroxyphthalate decarboxylase
MNMKFAPLKAMIGDYENTHLLRHGPLTLNDRAFDFADVKVPNTAFKRTVRDLEFDLSELAIVTFLQAKEAGIPLSLLPCVVVSRYQHPYLMYNSKNGHLMPSEIRGKRIGVRSYPVTTVTWLRGMLLQEYGIRPQDNEWLAFEAPHVSQWKDPSWVTMATQEQDMLSMLENGELDCAVLGSAPSNPLIKPVFDPPQKYSEDWAQKHKVIQINHMIVVKNELIESNPDLIPEIYQLFKRARNDGLKSSQMNLAFPMGIQEVRPHLEFVIDLVHAQGLTQRRANVESLIHPRAWLD